MHQNKKNSETPQSVPEPFARCPKGVLGYLQILGSGDVGSARTEGHCLFSYSPLYLLLVYAVVRAADTLTVIAIALLQRSGHLLLFGPVWQPVHPATRLPVDDDPIAIGKCRFQFGRGILPTLAILCTSLHLHQTGSALYFLMLLSIIFDTIPKSLSLFCLKQCSGTARRYSDWRRSGRARSQTTLRRERSGCPCRRR